MIPNLKNRKITFNELMIFIALGVKHFRLMVLLFCFSLLCGIVYYIFTKPVYYAKGLIRVQLQSRVVDTESVYGDSELGSIIGQLTAPHIVERTARMLGVNATARELAEKYLRKMKVTPNSEGNIELEVWPTKREWARQWIEKNLDAFLEYRNEQRLKKRASTIQVFTADMMQIKEKIDQIVAARETYRDKQKTFEAELELKGLINIPAKLLEVQNRLENIVQLRDILKDESMDVISRLSLISQMGKGSGLKLGQLIPQPVSGSGITSNPSNTGGGTMVVVPGMLASSASLPWEVLERQQRQVLYRLRAMERLYLPGNPKMKSLQAELEKINQELDLELEIARDRIELEYAQLLDEKKSLEEKLPLFKESRLKVEKIIREMGEANAGNLSWEDYYSTMAKRLEVFDFGGEKERSQVEYMGLLQLNEIPISPNRGRVLVLFILIGLALGIGIPYLLEFLDHTVTLLDQAETDLGLKGLGVIPVVGRGKVNYPRELLIENEENRALREAFRLLRTNILMSKDAPTDRQVILITSSIPREGKSTVAVNLALALAQLGQHTLLIDSDFHRGRIHHVFGVRRAPGLTGVLGKKVPFTDACLHTHFPNLDLLPDGKNEDNVQEMLASTEFADLLGSLRHQYDRIIIDAPPILGLSETPVLAPLVDGVLMVIWSGHTPLSQIKTAVNILSINGARMLGCVLNRMDLTMATNYYYYYYYSDYYYRSYDRMLPKESSS